MSSQRVFIPTSVVPVKRQPSASLTPAVSVKGESVIISSKYFFTWIHESGRSIMLSLSLVDYEHDLQVLVLNF